MLTTASDQRLLRSISGRNYPDRMPFGWFFVAYSNDVGIGQVHTITCFGQEWVLFRNDQAEVGLIHAYCPHLGAHIGVGGKVDGTLVRCPFHAWGFDSAGYCRSVPYAKKMPPILNWGPATRALPVVERNKIIWAWYHPEDKQPQWVVDQLPEASSPGWTDFEKFEFEIATSVQDINENSADYAHLKYVHGHSSPLAGKTRYKDIERTIHFGADVKMPDSNGSSVSCHYSIDLYQKGPGVQVIRYQRIVELLLMFLMTPVTHEKTILRFAFTHPRYPRNSLEHKLIKDLLAEKVGKRRNMAGVHEDIPIWNNKIFRERPLLCDGDGPIMQFRKWFKQFHSS